MDDHFAGLDRAWCWIAPPPELRVAVSVLGVGSPEAGLQPVVQLRSRKARSGGRAWATKIHDVTGARPKEIGWVGLECRELWTRPPERFSCKITEGAPARASWDGWGRFQVEGEKTSCTMATRGMPIPERGRWYRKAPEPVLDHPDLVDVEPECFDGWLRARQHPEAPTETWEIRIDPQRARPVSLALALIASTGALCHRRATVSVARQ